MVKKYIRIVAGQYRRTRIEVPDAPGLRPTPDRVRETLFNWLSHLWDNDFAQKQVLDLFAGSGALGFEAASRGVAHVLMVESNPTALRELRSLRDRLKASHVRIHSGDARTVLARGAAARFDLILLDPPFGQAWFPDLLNQAGELLTDEGLIYAENDCQINAPDGYVALRYGRAGGVHYHLFHRTVT
ncbi:16S rRNA (guanine(966)-N(2))-methyltransferase RsmD [Orrella marina]|uniref:16S rRNA (Guanine(966)-N(2))-methyltransferase RsmD n=1 Tax=Orrella marina TaxID=2163011 RepID=A0A2R4XKL3_9BURK|nr:16S rRNA (guanine(966)-N(2))-methyltransferase RsmD [Orrella marina]AWB34320.1 16S rRNA (guanine(966)-N(2))-methyltransferase RsmD [Orrella marina]